MRIRAARPSEASEISRLAVESKAWWGYDEAAMTTFSRELTLRPADLAACSAHVLEESSELAGFYTIAASDRSPLQLGPDTLELEHLYVRAGRFREGLGSMLLVHAIESARGRGARRLWIQSDPNAEGFYARHGAVVLERIATSVPGRTLPLMELTL